jgi:hypothetical protein
MTFWKKQIGHKSAIFIICIGMLLLILSIAYLFINIRSIRHYYTIRHRTDVGLIQGWMTLNYISRSYAIPESLLLKTANVTMEQARHQSLSNIAKTHEESLSEIIKIIRNTILQYKAHITASPSPS